MCPLESGRLSRLGPWSSRIVALLIIAAATLVVALPKSFETLLLGVGVDVGADEEGDNVEEWHPGVLGQELLGKSQRQRGGDPADLHDGHETGLDGGANLVEGTGAGDDGHRGEVDGVLDGGDLGASRELVIVEKESWRVDPRNIQSSC